MITYWVSVHISHPVPSLECILKVLLWPDHAWQLGSPAAPAQMMQRSHYSFCRNHPTVLTDQQLPYPSLQFPIRNQSVKSKHVPPNQTYKMPCLWPSSSSPGPATLKRGSLKGFSLFHSWSGWGQIVFPLYKRQIQDWNRDRSWPGSSCPSIMATSLGVIVAGGVCLPT